MIDGVVRDGSSEFQRLNPEAIESISFLKDATASIYGMKDVYKRQDSVANQIAAGEVIQRPASVIKELVENAIDADAQNIHVLVTDAGKTCIQIIDDGKGMSETDARLSFEMCIRDRDLRVRTVANKSKMKVAIIQAIDRKVALDDIALSKGIEFGELLDEVEAIVYSGTKLNIDYFLEEIMDEDHMLDIYDYFKESTTDKIDDALDELGDEFTEEEDVYKRQR